MLGGYFDHRTVGGRNAKIIGSTDDADGIARRGWCLGVFGQLRRKHLQTKAATPEFPRINLARFAHRIGVQQAPRDAARHIVVDNLDPRSGRVRRHSADHIQPLAQRSQRFGLFATCARRMKQRGIQPIACHRHVIQTFAALLQCAAHTLPIRGLPGRVIQQIPRRPNYVGKILGVDGQRHRQTTSGITPFVRRFTIARPGHVHAIAVAIVPHSQHDFVWAQCFQIGKARRAIVHHGCWQRRGQILLGGGDGDVHFDGLQQHPIVINLNP